jgi:hypothetical protein
VFMKGHPCVDVTVYRGLHDSSSNMFTSLSLAGKYSDEMGRADEWYARGKIVSHSPRLLLLLLTSLWMHYRIS